MASASFWRGSWYILDDSLFPDSPIRSATASLGLGTIGMAASQGLVSRAELVKGMRAQRMARFGALYAVATSCVLVWRGTWMFWDIAYEQVHHCPISKEGPAATDKGHATTSGLASHVVALAGLVGCGLFASVLAPPAAASVIKDLSVKSAVRTYTGPAQQLVDRLFAPSAVSRSLHTKTGSHISPLNDRVLVVASKRPAVMSNMMKRSSRSFWK